MTVTAIINYDDAITAGKSYVVLQEYEQTYLIRDNKGRNVGLQKSYFSNLIKQK